MSALRIAMAQVNVTVGDLYGNGRILLDAAARAREAGAHIVVFPELALSGYPPEDLLLKPQFLRDCRAALDALGPQMPDLVALVGFPDHDAGCVYNAAALVRNGAVDRIYHKMELPNYGVFDEKRYFVPGSKPLRFEVAGRRVCVTICEDIWVEGSPAAHSAADADVTVNLSASPFHAGKLARRREVAAGFARRTGTTVVYTNLVGGQDELVFDGGSLAVDSAGELLAAAARFEEHLLCVDLPGAPPITMPELDPVDEVYRALVLGTRDYVRKNGFERVVIGLSGGIDSALTACVAAEALGAENVTGVTMPSQYTSDGTLNDAARQADALGLRLITVPIEPVYNAYLSALAEPLAGAEPDVTEENVQARIRGNLLMALSNKFGWLVLTTGNKSEFAVGYCTLYGDMAGGFAVIKDVPKTLVYDLARHVNRRAGREAIPQSIIDRPPSAELRPDQKDTDSLPAYEVLDPILEQYVERDVAPAHIAAPGIPRELVERIVRLVDRTEYKRRQSPPGIKITPKAFGRDRRLPITNRYRPQAGNH